MADGVVAHALVRGRVQGVGFRGHTRARAAQLGLSGWCANLDDGRVEVWCEGEPHKVEALLAFLQRGPGAARVEGVLVERGAAAVALAAPQLRVGF